MLLAQRKPASDTQFRDHTSRLRRRRRCASNEITNITANTGPGWIIPAHDANFNVTALTDNTGAVIERYDYTPYGQVTILKPDFSNDADGVSDYEQNVLFAGYQYDAESGMYHVRRRSYHPMLGRWVQRDPLDYIDGAHVYEYVRSSPTFTTDPTGRSCADVRANC